MGEDAAVVETEAYSEAKEILGKLEAGEGQQQEEVAAWWTTNKKSNLEQKKKTQAYRKVLLVFFSSIIVVCFQNMMYNAPKSLPPKSLLSSTFTPLIRLARVYTDLHGWSNNHIDHSAG